MDPLRIARSAMMATVMTTLTSGCVVYESTSIPRTGDRPHAEQTIDLVEAGITTREWLVARLGRPDAVIPEDDGSETLRYDEGFETRSRFSALLLSVDVHDEQSTHYWFRCRDGIVTAYWRT